MDFSLSYEQTILVETVRGFIAEHLAPHEKSIEETGQFDAKAAASILAKTRSLGLYAMNMPEKLGGGGLTTVDWMLVEEQFGRTTDVLIRRAFGNVYDILLAGTQVQQARWLRPSIEGERVFSVAFTEPEAGSDAAAVRTTATRSGDGWVLNGHKCYISDALVSDFFIVTAATGPGQVSTFIVDKGLLGFEIGSDQPMMGLRGTSHAELWFNDVQLGPECLLGEEGKGLKLALSTLNRVRLAQVGARSIGRAAKILDEMIVHAQTRRQFSKTLSSFQHIQTMLADSAVEIASARLLLLHTAWLLDQGEEARAQISMVKLQASETLGRVADRAVQVFGGSGYSKELPIERYFRDARIYRIFDGTSEIHRSQIARGLSGTPDDPFHFGAI